jgi:hypothetical protein
MAARKRSVLLVGYGDEEDVDEGEDHLLRYVIVVVHALAARFSLSAAQSPRY